MRAREGTQEPGLRVRSIKQLSQVTQRSLEVGELPKHHWTPGVRFPGEAREFGQIVYLLGPSGTNALSKINMNLFSLPSEISRIKEVYFTSCSFNKKRNVIIFCVT
jgi:hypothetical protein